MSEELNTGNLSPEQMEILLLHAKGEITLPDEGDNATPEGLDGVSEEMKRSIELRLKRQKASTEQLDIDIAREVQAEKVSIAVGRALNSLAARLGRDLNTHETITCITETEQSMGVIY